MVKWSETSEPHPVILHHISLVQHQYKLLPKIFANIILRRSCSLFWKWYFDQIHKISDSSYIF